MTRHRMPISPVHNIVRTARRAPEDHRPANNRPPVAAGLFGELP